MGFNLHEYFVLKRYRYLTILFRVVGLVHTRLLYLYAWSVTASK